MSNQPSEVELDDGGKQVEWRIRQFEIEITFDPDGQCDSVYVHDLVSGYKLEWDKDHEHD